MGGQGGLQPGNRGAGSLREVGNETTGSGIPKVAGTGRNRKKFQYFALHRSNGEKHKEAEANKEGAGTGKFRQPVPPPLNNHILCCCCPSPFKKTLGYSQLLEHPPPVQCWIGQ